MGFLYRPFRESKACEQGGRDGSVMHQVWRYRNIHGEYVSSLYRELSRFEPAPNVSGIGTRLKTVHAVAVKGFSRRASESRPPGSQQLGSEALCVVNAIKVSPEAAETTYWCPPEFESERVWPVAS